MGVWSDFVDLLHRVERPTFEAKVDTNRAILSPLAPNSFTITIEESGEELVVSALFWHGHFREAEQAFAVSRWLLSPYYRVVERYRGAALVETWLERWSVEGWEAVGESLGVFSLSFGRQKIYATQQDVDSPSAPYDTIETGAKLDQTGLPLDSFIGRRLLEPADKKKD